MARRVRYHPLFDCDVLEAANWYDGQSSGLGTAFSANVRTATEALIAAPKRFGRTTLGLRYAKVQRFPYIVLFDFTDDVLLILGVLHTARSIEKWWKNRG